jgi:hypothetical protein
MSERDGDGDGGVYRAPALEEQQDDQRDEDQGLSISCLARRSSCARRSIDRRSFHLTPGGRSERADRLLDGGHDVERISARHAQDVQVHGV